jgi:hypothetical protein
MSTDFGPKPICAGCGVLMSVFGQPLCGECMRMSGFEPETHCQFCLSMSLSSEFTLRGGLHYNKDGGYAGKCVQL